MARINTDRDYICSGRFYFIVNDILIAFVNQYEHLFIKYHISNREYFLSFSLKRNKFEKWIGFGLSNKNYSDFWKDSEWKWEEMKEQL